MIDMTKPLTCSLWVKTPNPYATYPILEGSLKGGIMLRLSFYPQANELYYTDSAYRVASVKNATDYKQWRHVAISFLGGNQYVMYLNADPWPSTITKRGTLHRQQFDTLTIGKRATQYFKGSMACLTLFQRGLRQEQIRKWMQTCP